MLVGAVDTALVPLHFLSIAERPYQKRKNREERGYFKLMPEVLLGAFAVVSRVGGFGGEGPGGFVSFRWSKYFARLHSRKCWNKRTASYVDAPQEDGDVSEPCM